MRSIQEKGLLRKSSGSNNTSTRGGRSASQEAANMPGMPQPIRKLEIIMRGFGQGREAVTKVLLGTEGTRLRDAIVRVVDKTKLKIGGPRSPKPRRLG